MSRAFNVSQDLAPAALPNDVEMLQIRRDQDAQMEQVHRDRDLDPFATALALLPHGRQICREPMYPAASSALSRRVSSRRFQYQQHFFELGATYKL
jgi:hypothetical protein